MAHDVFISYAHQDKAVADAACAVLERRGVRCWVAPRDVTPGLDWSAEIVDAIAGSRVLVLIYSANSNASHQIKREVERAVAAGLPVLPVRIEDVPMSKALEYFISTPHWLDALTPPLEAHLERLAETVRVILGGMKPPHPGPMPGQGRGAGVGVGAGSRRRAGLIAGVVVAGVLLGLAGWRLLGGAGSHLDRRLVGEWSLNRREQTGTWTGSLTIERNGQFVLAIGVEDAGTISASGGRYRMVTGTGVPISGTYARQGNGAVSLTGPLGTATWTRQDGEAGADLVGTWQLVATVEGLSTTTTFTIAPTGAYRLRTSTPDRGRMEGGDGLFKMVSSVSGKVVSGTYEFSAADRLSLVGPAGPALWVKR